VKQGATKALREEAKLEAMASAYRSKQKSPMDHAVVLIIRQCATIRTMDPDNLIAQLKAAFDGFTDAGIWVDDRQLLFLPPVQFKNAKDPHTDIWVRPISPQEAVHLRSRFFPNVPTDRPVQEKFPF